MKALFILNAAPYDGEATYNALRLAAALANRTHNTVRLYLMGDAVAAGQRDIALPEGRAHREFPIGKVVSAVAENVAACGSCLDTRDITQADLHDGIHRGTLEELADWSEWADKVFVF